MPEDEKAKEIKELKKQMKEIVEVLMEKLKEKAVMDRKVPLLKSAKSLITNGMTDDLKLAQKVIFEK